MAPEDKNLQHFADNFTLEHLINEPTCFKGIPSYIDLIITNRKSYFKNTCVSAISFCISVNVLTNIY